MSGNSSVALEAGMSNIPASGDKPAGNVNSSRAAKLRDIASDMKQNPGNMPREWANLVAGRLEVSAFILENARREDCKE